MTAIILKVSDLTVHDGEPRVRDQRLAEVLEFKKPADIKQLIARNRTEMERHGEVFCAAQKTSAAGGRPGVEYLLNEAQALLTAMLARTPRAPDVRKMLIDVFMDWRRGHLREVSARPEPLPITGEAVPVLTAKLALVREARHLFGHDRARSLWNEIGLPTPELVPDGGQEDARACLEEILGQKPDGSPLFVREMIEQALNDHDLIAQRLQSMGLRVARDPEEGFLVANAHPWLAQVFATTRWSHGRHMRVLRRLSGAAPAPKQRYGSAEARGSFIPSRFLDEPPLL